MSGSDSPVIVSAPPKPEPQYVDLDESLDESLDVDVEIEDEPIPVVDLDHDVMEPFEIDSDDEISCILDVIDVATIVVDDDDGDDPNTPAEVEEYNPVREKDDWCVKKFWASKAPATPTNKRIEIPSWCKVAVVAGGGDLRSRKHLVEVLGLKTTPKVQQCKKWEEEINQHRAQSGPGKKTACRLVDTSTHHSKYKSHLLLQLNLKEKSSISASKIPVTPICHGIFSRNFFERFDFVTKKVRFRDKPIFSLTHKIQFSDK